MVQRDSDCCTVAVNCAWERGRDIDLGRDEYL